MESKKQKHERAPSKKLSLKKRKFSIKLAIPNEDEIIEFPLDDGQQVFSQSLSGDLKFTASNGMQLMINWYHPEQDENPPNSLPFAERNERNDISRIDPYVVKKCFEKHKVFFQEKNSNGCLEATNIKVDTGGYLRVMLDYQWFRFTHIVMQHFLQENVYKAAARLGLEVSDVDCSHLCGNTWCCYVEHLLFEKHSTNMERNTCHERGYCSSHEPRCIF
jgi:hypothetical protein